MGTDQTLIFSDVIAEGISESFSFELEAGNCYCLQTSGDHESEILLRLILGFQSPDAGDIFVLGKAPHSLDSSGLISLRRQIGVVYANGGFLSNLNIWENLILQSDYHGEGALMDISHRAGGILNEIGFSGNVTDLPSKLSLFHKRQAAIARVMLGNPKLILFQSTLDNIGKNDRQQLQKGISELIKQNQDAVKLFLTHHPDSLAGLSEPIISIKA